MAKTKRPRANKQQRKKAKPKLKTVSAVKKDNMKNKKKDGKIVLKKAKETETENNGDQGLQATKKTVLAKKSKNERNTNKQGLKVAKTTVLAKKIKKEKNTNKQGLEATKKTKKKKTHGQDVKATKTSKLEENNNKQGLKATKMSKKKKMSNKQGLKAAKKSKREKRNEKQNMEKAVEKFLNKLHLQEDPVDVITEIYQLIKRSNNQIETVQKFVKYSDCLPVLMMHSLKITKTNKLRVAVLDCLTLIISRLNRELEAHCEIVRNITSHIMADKYFLLIKPLKDTKFQTVSIFHLLRAIVLFGRGGKQVAKFLNDENVPWHRFFYFGKSRSKEVQEAYVSLLLTLARSTDPCVNEFLCESDKFPTLLKYLKNLNTTRVIQVLNTLTYYVLMNPNVSKAVKREIFSPESVQHVINLLIWNNDSPREKKKQERNLVLDRRMRQTALEFLSLLCSSVDHGLLVEVNDKQWQNPNLNGDVFKIITSMLQIWQHGDVNSFFSVVFASAPELIPRFFKFVKFELSSGPNDFFMFLMRMLSSVVKSQKPWQWALSRGCKGVITCIFPGSPIHQKFYLQLIASESPAIQHGCCNLMLAAMKKVRETLKKLQDLEISVARKEEIERELIKAVKNTFTEDMVKTLIKVWESIVEGQMAHSTTSDVVEDNEVSLPPALEVIAIVEFLGCYSELMPSSAIQSFCNPIVMLKTIQFVKKWESKELEADTSIRVEFWTFCCSILRESINHWKFSDSDEDLFHVILETLLLCYNKSGAGTTSSLPHIKDIHYNLVEILVLALDKRGISDDCEGIRHWLNYANSTEHMKLITFFTRVIQKTLSSYSQYTDDLIELQEKQLASDEDCSFVDFNMSDLCQGYNIVVQGYNKPFSRFIFAAVDLLSANPDSDCVDYFSHVLEDYIHTMHNPGPLLFFLSDKESVINEGLRMYVASIVSYPELSGADDLVEAVEENLTLSDLLKISFRMHDLAPLDALIELEDFADFLEKEIHIVVSQMFLYTHVELKKGNLEKGAFTEKYTSLLKQLYVNLIVEDKQPTATSLLKAAMEHPVMLASFHPFSSSHSPLSALCQHFIGEILENHPEISSCTYPYYSKIISDIKTVSIQQNEMVNFWSSMTPFFTLKTLTLSFREIEEVFSTYIQLPCSLSPFHGSFLLKVLKVLHEITTAKRQPREENIQLMVRKLIEWNALPKEDNPIVGDLIGVLNEFLPDVLSANVAKQITKDELKRICLDCPSSDICLRILEVYPSHGKVMASILKKHKKHLHLKIPLIIALLNDEEASELMKECLPHLATAAQEWAMSLTDEREGFQVLFKQCLQADVFDEDALVEICKSTDTQCVQEKIFPNRDLHYLLLLCEKVVEKVEEDKRPFESGNHYLVRILVNSIINGCKLGDKSPPLLLSHCKLLDSVIEHISPKELKKNISNVSRWSALVKQILRRGLHDPNAGAQLVQTLANLIEGLCKGEKEVKLMVEGLGLGLETIRQLVFSHSNFTALMFQREMESQKLKESVVNLLQVIVDAQPSVCKKAQVPILLGAYEASMSALDQRLFKLLHTYSKAGAMKIYQPVIWGDAAITHFSKMKLNKNYMEPKVMETLKLLDKKKLLRSCYHFDVSLPLEPQDICGDDRTLYDMRFLVPLMMCLSQGDSSEIDFAESGAVVVGLACLSSHHDDVWSAGASLLKIAGDKMANSKHHRLKLPWLWMLTIVGAMFKKNSHRVPSIVVHFLIRVACLLSNPQNPIYFTILRLLFVKPQLEVLKVPEFNRLFISQDVLNNQRILSFLLDFLSTGIRHPEDYFISEKRNVGTHIIALLQSPVYVHEIKVQALKVLESIVCIPEGAQDLVDKYNVLTILPLVITSSERGESSAFCKETLISSVVRILAHIWQSMLTSRDEKIQLVRRLEITNPLKRKLEDTGMSEDRGDQRNTKKKAKRENFVDVNSTEPSTDLKIVIDKSKKQRKLCPAFLEEYLGCLLHISSVVIGHGTHEATSQYLTVLATTLDWIQKNTLLWEKAALHKFALDPDIMKKRVYSSLPWEQLYKCLEKYLTDSEVVRILGEATVKYSELWKEEKLTLSSKDKESFLFRAGSFNALKDAVFKVLDVLGR